MEADFSKPAGRVRENRGLLKPREELTIPVPPPGNGEELELAADDAFSVAPALPEPKEIAVFSKAADAALADFGARPDPMAAFSVLVQPFSAGFKLLQRIDRRYFVTPCYGSAPFMALEAEEQRAFSVLESAQAAETKSQALFEYPGAVIRAIFYKAYLQHLEMSGGDLLLSSCSHATAVTRMELFADITGNTAGLREYTGVKPRPLSSAYKPHSMFGPLKQQKNTGRDALAEKARALGDILTSWTLSEYGLDKTSGRPPLFALDAVQARYAVLHEKAEACRTVRPYLERMAEVLRSAPGYERSFTPAELAYIADLAPGLNELRVPKSAIDQDVYFACKNEEAMRSRIDLLVKQLLDRSKDERLLRAAERDRPRVAAEIAREMLERRNKISGA